jgi:hypothetical protein
MPYGRTHDHHPMKKKRLSTCMAAAILILGGLSLIYYGFELVSIPNVREHHESLYVLSGIVVALSGIVLIIARTR